jgi:hypothetical protein
MEPISALAVATSIVTFIDFTTKTVLFSREIHQDGTSIGVADIDHRAKELKSFVNGLTAPISGREESLHAEYEVQLKVHV